MKKVVRDLKRGVNKKVLKVSGIERKVLDATSSEPWGPNGTYLLDIANATRNHQDYQIIMAVIWRRISDTGKKWRHVYKALQLLEYLVAHGSERVIDDIMEHGYQISSLAEFQYIDSSGRDQGINVRKKSQMLVALVNDKEKIQEVRSKAQSNKDKGSYGESVYSGSDYGDDGNYRSRSGHNRDDERYGRDAAYHDESYRGQGSNNNNQFSARSPSVDGYTDRYGDDDHLSSQSGGGRTDDQSPDNRGHDHSFEAHNNMEALPSYEEVIKNSQDTVQDDSTKESVVDPKENSSEIAVAGESEASQNNTVDNFDEFDPRGSVSAAQPTASSQELDIFGFSASDSNNALALVPANSATSQSDTTTTFFGADFFGAPSTQQADENPFGDAPFKAIPQENVQESSFQQSSLVDGSQRAESFSNFDFGDAFGPSTFAPNATNVNNQQHTSLTPSFSTPEFPVDNSSNDILDSILPRTGSAPMFSSQDSPFESASLDSNSAQTNPFQLSDMTNAQSEQMNPFQISTNETNPFQNFGFSASAAQESQGPAKENIHACQMNSFHSSKQLVSHKSLPNNTEISPIVPEVSKGLPTDSQSSSQLDFFQSLGQPSSQAPIENNSKTQMVSVPEAAKGSPTNNMQSSSQMNFFQSSSPSASQEPNTNSQVQSNNTQASEMNFFEQSVTPIQTTSQEPSNNTQTSQLSSQESPSNIQPSQMNFFESPKQSQIVSQGLQTNDAETAQANNLQMVQTNNTQQPPQTNNMPPPPQTSNNMQSPPQTNNNIQQPPQAIFQQPPQTNNFQQPPQGNNFLRAPQGNNFLQPNNFQQPPQSNSFHQLPQGKNFQQPPQTNYFQQPPQSNYFQQAPQTNNFQQPPQTNSFQQPPQTNNMQQPPQTNNMQQPPQMSGMQAPQTSNMQTPQINYFQQRPQYNMPQMNVYQQSLGPTPNMQMGQMNYRPFAQGPQTHMQVAQPNFGPPPPPASHSQGMQAHLQTNQTSFVQPMSSSQATQNAVSSITQAPNVGTQANMQTSQTMQSDPFASQAGRPQVQKGKFETKSTVWADTLNRGLVNLDISGAKTNPLDGIGVDFDAINRKDKRLGPKSSGPPPTSTVVMGKAMGSGSGIGRSAASSIAPPPNPMIGPNNMGMGPMGMGMRGPGMSMGGYGGNMNQAPMGMNMGMNMGMMGQNAPPMHPPNQGMQQGGGYNPIMGMVGYNPQHQPPYGGGGGYR